MWEFNLSNGISGTISTPGEGVEAFFGLLGQLPKFLLWFAIGVWILVFYAFLAWVTGGITDIFKIGAVEAVDGFIQDAMPWPIYLLVGLIVVAIGSVVCLLSSHELAGDILMILGVLLWPAISLLYTSVVDMGDTFRWYMALAALLLSFFLLPVTAVITLLFAFAAWLVLLALTSLFGLLTGDSSHKTHKKSEAVAQKRKVEKKETATGTSTLATGILSGVGGRANVMQVKACVTRLRFTLKDSRKVQGNAIKAAGAMGVICPSTTECQVVVGTRAELLCQELQKLL